MTTVAIYPATYEDSDISAKVFQALDATVGDVITAGSRVLVKPNFLTSAPPEKALTTHPSVIRAAARYALDKGARVRIGDSQAAGSFNRILKQSGTTEALKDLDVEAREFRGSVKVDIGEPFGAIEISEAAMNADVVINLPKLKTHSQMLLTLGVKNLFGCIVGLRKPDWHLRVGTDRERFARLLVAIYKAVNPAVTLMDGVLAMEGQGPGSGGTPRTLGILLASRSAVALDMTVCDMVGVDPQKLLTNKVALEKGLLDGPVTVEGVAPRVDNFRLPELGPLLWGPSIFHGLLRRHLTQRPVCDDSLCQTCGECWKYCPAKAVARDGKKVRFDYNACIRCYCCVEVCPHGALSAREPALGKALKRITGMKS